MTVLEAYGGRLAIEATVEPPITVSRNQGAKITGRREAGRSGRRYSVPDSLEI